MFARTQIKMDVDEEGSSSMEVGNVSAMDGQDEGGARGYRMHGHIPFMSGCPIVKDKRSDAAPKGKGG